MYVISNLTAIIIIQLFVFTLRFLQNMHRSIPTVEVSYYAAYNMTYTHSQSFYYLMFSVSVMYSQLYTLDLLKFTLFSYVASPYLKEYYRINTSHCFVCSATILFILIRVAAIMLTN